MNKGDVKQVLKKVGIIALIIIVVLAVIMFVNYVGSNTPIGDTGFFIPYSGY